MLKAKKYVVKLIVRLAIGMDTANAAIKMREVKILSFSIPLYNSPSKIAPNLS